MKIIYANSRGAYLKVVTIAVECDYYIKGVGCDIEVIQFIRVVLFCVL